MSDRAYSFIISLLRPFDCAPITRVLRLRARHTIIKLGAYIIKDAGKTELSPNHETLPASSNPDAWRSLIPQKPFPQLFNRSKRTREPGPLDGASLEWLRVRDGGVRFDASYTQFTSRRNDRGRRTGNGSVAGTHKSKRLQNENCPCR